MAQCEIQCPVCGQSFEAREWDAGSCPTCDNKYYWEEEFTEDNYWPVLYWETRCVVP